MASEAVKTFKILKAEAVAAGAQDVRMAWGGKHPRIEATAANGHYVQMYFAGTSSDHRAIKNCLARLRRFLTGGC